MIRISVRVVGDRRFFAKMVPGHTERYIWDGYADRASCERYEIPPSFTTAGAEVWCRIRVSRAEPLLLR